MKLVLFLTSFSILFLLQTKAEITTPVITYAAQISPSTIKVKWDVDDVNSLNLTRFSVFLFFDGFMRAWPVQINRVRYDVTETYAIGEEVTSTTECFSNCVADYQCVFVRFTYFENQPSVPYCHYVHSYNETKHPSVVGEFGEVTEYKNEVFLENVPYNQVYGVHVSVFDSNSKEWSPLAVSPTVDMSLNLRLIATQVNTTRARLGWDFIGDFQTYDVSRYILTVSLVNDLSHVATTYYVTDQLSTFQMELNYAGNDFTNFKSVNNQDECVQLCFADPLCVLMLYNSDNNTCYIQYSVSVFDGMFHADSYSVYSVKTQTRSYELDLLPNIYYKIRLEGITPFGSRFNSNEIIYHAADYKQTIQYVNIKDLSVYLKWNSSVKLVPGDRPLVLYSIDDSEYSYYYNYSVDYIDMNQLTLETNDLKQCFDLCVQDVDCRAFTFQKGNLACTLKNLTNDYIRCAQYSDCVTLLDIRDVYRLDNLLVNTKYCVKLLIRSHFGYDGVPSNSICFQIPLRPSLIAMAGFAQNSSGLIFCDNGLSNSSFEAVNWYKDDDLVDFDQLNVTLGADSRFLFFNRMSYKLHNGVYRCVTTLYNGQRIENENRFELQVTAPGSVFINSERVLRVNESSVVGVDCVYDGYPVPRVSWVSKLDTNLNTIHSDGVITLVFNEITRKESGEYLCVIENGVSETINIIVQYKPEKPIIRNVTVGVDETAIEWNFIDNGNLDITSVNLKIVYNETLTRIIILEKGNFTLNMIKLAERVVSSRSGELQLQSENELGQSEYSDKFIVISNDENDNDATTTAEPTESSIGETVGVSITVALVCISIFIIVYLVERRMRGKSISSVISFRNQNYNNNSQK